MIMALAAEQLHQGVGLHAETAVCFVATQMLQARSLGMNAICVAEQLHEVGMLIAASKRLGVRPAVGMRAKLHTRHSGQLWETLAGQYAHVKSAASAAARPPVQAPACWDVYAPVMPTAMGIVRLSCVLPAQGGSGS